MPSRSLFSLLFSTLLLGCAAGFSALYPPRPAASPGPPIADPAPSRVVLHATVTSAALARALDDAVPKTGEGTFPFVGGPRRFTWQRDAVRVGFTQGRIALDLHVAANASMPIGSIDIPLDFHILAEPVITSRYVVRMQSTEVRVTSPDRLVNAADTVADVLRKIKLEVEGKLEGFSYDLYPTLAEAHLRIARPMNFPLGDAQGCAVLKVLSVEAGPTVLADGIEKDLAMVVAPFVTIPCTPGDSEALLPPLSNVATIQPGPFVVTVPIAANYEELAKAMTLVFTNGKLFFSKDFPDLYLEAPEVYASKDQLVLKLHMRGPIHKFGIDTVLDGDLFMTGHPTVEDNELSVPDLEPTIETSSFLLKLKAVVDGDAIRDQARAALRLDLGERLRTVREKLSTDLAFGNGQGCLQADTHKIEVSSVHVHTSYLRLYIAVTASASVYVPCP